MKAWHDKGSDSIDLPNIAASGGEVMPSISTFKSRHVKFIKTVALVVVGLFLHQQIVWATGGEAIWTTALKGSKYDYKYDNYKGGQDFEVPYDVAQKQATHLNGGDEVIIQIQDAHASLSAQYSIVKLLDSLVANYELNFVALEGSKGLLDTSVLSTFPDKDIRENTADFLMREGRMSAGEFFTVTRDNDIRLYGVEDDKLYRKNVESFCDVASNRTELVSIVKAFEKNIDALEEKVYSDDLKTFIAKSREHREGSLSFTDYWKQINEFAKRFKLDTSRYEELKKLLETVELETQIDFVRANQERRDLIDALSKSMDKGELEALVLKSVDFKQNKISQGAFHSYLATLAEKHGVKTEGYENLIAFTKYVSLYETIDIFGMYHEIEAFEDNLREKFYRNDYERKLHKMAKMARLLDKLYSMELTNGDCAYIDANRAEYNAAEFAGFIKETSKKYNVPVGSYDIAQMLSGIDEALEFYHVAESRNKAMLSNTVRHMRTEGSKVAALITGGYHTKGLTKLMEDKELSYLVIVPKFEKDKERPYVAILTGKKKPYQKLLDSGKYQLAVEAYFYSTEGDITRMQTAIFHALGETVLEGKDLASMKELWKRAYSSRYESFTPRQIKDMPFEPIDPDEFDRFVDDIHVVSQGSDRVIIGIGHELAYVTLSKQDGSTVMGTATSNQKAHYAKRREGQIRKDLEKRVLNDSERKEIEQKLSSSELVEEIAAQLGVVKYGVTTVTLDKIVTRLRAKGVQIPENWNEYTDLKHLVSGFAGRVFKEMRKITHIKVNNYIRENIPEGLLADTLEERQANLKKLYPEKVESADYKISARVIPVVGLYVATGLKAHLGLGRAYGEPVMYIDDDYCDEQVLKHEFYEMSRWEAKRRDLNLDPQQMRDWIFSHLDEARKLNDEFHGQNPYEVEDHRAPNVKFVYADELDIIIAASSDEIAEKVKDIIKDLVELRDKPGKMTQKIIDAAIAVVDAKMKKMGITKSSVEQATWDKIQFKRQATIYHLQKRIAGKAEPSPSKPQAKKKAAAQPKKKVAAAKTQPENISDMIAEARRCLPSWKVWQANNFDRAIELLTKVLEKDKNNQEARELLQFAKRSKLEAEDK
ncbi:MAG: hypothetical protein WBD12_03910, partial [Candidatus Omnitrophota bacterium]